jgi:hypothetical protein
LWREGELGATLLVLLSLPLDAMIHNPPYKQLLIAVEVGGS